MKVQIFDFEVFKQDWFVTFLDIQNNTYKTIRNNSLELIDHIERNKKDTCFVGFNNKNFDNYCLKCIYNGINPYKLVHWVIEMGQYPWTMPELRFKRNINGLISFDALTGLKLGVSLKEAEANMGMSIEEMNFDLSYGGKLPADVYARLLDYNKHDCDATRGVFNQIDQYETKKTLIETFGLKWSDMIRTFPGLIGNILGAKPTPQLPFFYYKKPKCITLKDQSIVDTYEKHEFRWKEDEFEFDKKIQDINFKFAIGGGHGALENFIFETTNDEYIVCVDVHNLYLNLMINNTNPELQYYSRAIKYPEKLKYIKNKREEYKQAGNKELAKAFKAALVPIYGSMLASDGRGGPAILTDWVQGRNVCITGQLALWMLAEMVIEVPTVKLFNLNTDGIYVTINKQFLDKLQIVLDDWQKRLGLILEIDIIKKGKVVQKDVNNYILYDELKKEIKTKGRDVNKWKGGTCTNNSCSIVDEAIVKYFIYKTPINETIFKAFENNEAIKFQIVLARKGKNFTKTYWGDKEVQKVNRVFPTTDTTKPELTKLKNGTKYKFPDAPEHCYVFNKDLKEIRLDEIQLDLNYYINLAKKKIDKFIKK